MSTLDRPFFIALLLALPLAGCSAPLGSGDLVRGCAPSGPARPICLFQNPEDLVALPGGDAILASEYASPDGGRPGRLSLFTLDDEKHRILFRGGDATRAEPAWGDESCPGPPPRDFSPHGIHLSTRSGGALQLLVVQHGGRESVEFFEVEGTGADRSLVWRGCVLAPAHAFLNAVAATPGGGFVATNMMERLEEGEDRAEALHADDTSGYVVTWSPESGLGRLAGSEGARPNGIEVSPDGRYVFLNSAGEDEVRRIARASGRVDVVARIEGLDNARWATDGRLIVASIRTENDDVFARCMGLMSQGEGACPVAFRILAIDPSTMKIERLYQNEGPPMGGGTIGLVVGNELFVGSFSGDRILRIALDESTSN